MSCDLAVPQRSRLSPCALDTYRVSNKKILGFLHAFFLIIKFFKCKIQLAGTVARRCWEECEAGRGAFGPRGHVRVEAACIFDFRDDIQRLVVAVKGGNCVVPVLQKTVGFKTGSPVSAEPGRWWPGGSGGEDGSGGEAVRFWSQERGGHSAFGTCEGWRSRRLRSHELMLRRAGNRVVSGIVRSRP